MQNHLQFGQIQLIHNAVPVEILSELYTTLPKIGWSFGWNTPSNPHSRYWHYEIGHGGKKNVLDVSDKVRAHPLPIFAKYLDFFLQHLAPAGTKILRFYMNAHTYGTDGWPHTDTDRPGEQTCVLYLNHEWKPEWGGETVIFNKDKEIVASVLPKGNRILSFPADSLHAPRPLSKEFEGLRIVLVVKLAPADLSVAN
ncbi:2OG-Fe(II) oxygenase [Undibacterium fentianense]|uniref:2OG-Fe(II) oxygenase n=1 Tax=Undibacterium fentianense TaxID=2828728 RepID=A0A941DZS5_9BURK|nr:2OG-Fe(II) oxygenase [Undibacterium fentianense]MBR7799760.1 2OG-Fe(II) oxygenase [Undibacterium fentianense]